MAKASPVEVVVTNLDPEVQGFIGDVLREEHGVHGLALLDSEEDNYRREQSHELEISQDREEIRFNYTSIDGDTISETYNTERYEILVALSRFAVERLVIQPQEQTSREDSRDLLKYSGVRPNIDVDPSEWIVSNPLMSDLCRRYPQYGNMIRYLCNERGLFLKVGNYPNQRAYWNSTLNGGLPVHKKADPIHEGTFMLHDLFHFIPADPLLGSETISDSHKSVYLAHRLLSEASTLVLADMVAVHEADIGIKGYDISKRKIFPVYQSIIDSTKKVPSADKLLAANAYFCFTGDPIGFKVLGATEEITFAYKSKYEAIFRDDFMWNLQNFNEMAREMDDDPNFVEYYDWIATHTDLPLLSKESTQIVDDDGSLDIPKMLSLFRADFATAFRYQEPIDETSRIKLGFTKYLAGQRVVFARFGNQLDATESLVRFDDHFMKLKHSLDIDEIRSSASNIILLVDSYIDTLAERGVLLPHQLSQYKYAAPLYPVKFVNYERSKRDISNNLSIEMRRFLGVNKGQLSRLLDIVSA